MTRRLNMHDLERVAEDAQTAFWAVVAERFPTVTGGDFPPDATHEFSSACERAVELWLRFNTDEDAPLPLPVEAER